MPRIILPKLKIYEHALLILDYGAQPQYVEETYQYVEEPQYHTTEYNPSENNPPEYYPPEFEEQPAPPPPEPSPRSQPPLPPPSSRTQDRPQAKKSKSNFLLKKAFNKVANLFDSLFYRG